MDFELFKAFSEYPFIYKNEFFNSTELEQNRTCERKCNKKDCLNIFENGKNKYICSKGYNNILFEIADRKYILNGIIFKSNNSVPKGRKTVRRKWIVKESDIDKYIDRLKTVEKYTLLNINENTIKNLSMFHDFKTSIGIFHSCTEDIIRNLPGNRFEDKLRNGSNSHKDLYDSLDLLQSQLGMIDVIVNPSSISFGTKKDINIYQLFDRIKYLFAHSKINRKNKVKIELHNDGIVKNSNCYDTIQFIPLILLDNAIKYSAPHSTIELVFEQSYKELTIEVRNIGPFVKDKDRERIFRKFIRGENGIEYSGEGLGVGLWIAQEILKVHNSELKYYKENKSKTDTGLNIFEFNLETL